MRDRTLPQLETRGIGTCSQSAKAYIDFTSNDSLGYAHHPKIIESIQKAAFLDGVGSGGSRLLSGDIQPFHHLEEEVACFKGYEAALVFNSGYQLNVGVLSSILKKGDVVFIDRLCHASLYDGVRLSGVSFWRFRHQDMLHLEQLLEHHRKAYNRAFIITESLYSMEGDFVPLISLIKLKKYYNASLYMDEAHATGLYGPNCSGWVEACQAFKDVDICVGTFGKALGVSGAYIACSNQLKHELVNTCRSFIYSTAMPLPIVAAIRRAIMLIVENRIGIKAFLEKTVEFRAGLKKKNIPFLGESHIVPIVVGSNEKALHLSEMLKQKGYWIAAIRTPTVPLGYSRVRISLAAHHTDSQLNALSHDLQKLYFSR